MHSIYSYSLRHDAQGRIIKKTETVQGRSNRWIYAYDKKGRLFEAHLGNRLICQCYYDRQGRRIQDSFPATHGVSTRTFRYTMENRLQAAGNNGYTHDKQGMRILWNHGGNYTRYEYAPDHRLLRAIREWDGTVFEFAHDDNGQRAAKFRDGTLIEAYHWLDFIRLAAFYDGVHEFTFAYRSDERTPHAMRRDDGAVFTLHYDQVGSLRVVADQGGNVIQETLYDPFGGIIESTNPDFRVPIGFAGGLHDRDLGFVRFGWRDYDTFTGRWTAPDPLGDKGGDPDWYGYCLDDPVNGVDPLGLFRFGKRPLSFLPDSWHWIGTDGSTADKGNYELKHEQGFYEDGTGDNVGLSKSGTLTNEDITKYTLDETHYDDKGMRRAQESLDPGEYKACKWGGKSNNCQDYADRLRERYRFLRTADKH
jgi:RHS repeat-associated protein